MPVSSHQEASREERRPGSGLDALLKAGLDALTTGLGTLVKKYGSDINGALPGLVDDLTLALAQRARKPEEQAGRPAIQGQRGSRRVHRGKSQPEAGSTPLPVAPFRRKQADRGAPSAAAVTLRGALRDTDEHRWRGMRSRQRNYIQASYAVATIEAIDPRCASNIKTIPKSVLRRAAKQWLAAGLKESTVVGRLNCLSAMGVDVQGCRPRIPRNLLWWLSPEQEVVLLAHLRASSDQRSHVLADLVFWTTRTALRIEESLALKWTQVHFRADGKVSVTVPGLKTNAAQATLPVSDEAAALLVRRRAASTGREVFGVGYVAMQRAWVQARLVLGLEDPKSATLKALRRSAIRYLHVDKAMPLDQVRHYARHENVQTTMGYLRLTGGYSEGEMGRWL